jgi:hypothetical protein
LIGFTQGGHLLVGHNDEVMGLHLSSSGADEAFMTFDKALVRRAAKFAVRPQVRAA